MQERIEQLKRQARTELEKETAAFTKKASTHSYAYAMEFRGIEDVVFCEQVCSELKEITGETEELLAQSIEKYRERVTNKLITDNPANAVETIHYKAMRHVLDRLRY